MKKNKKIALILLVLVITMCTSVYAVEQLGQGLNSGLLGQVTNENKGISSSFETTFSNIFGTIFFILKVIGVFGVVMEGVRYMYAGAQSKAKIKQDLLWIVIGTVFIFGADIILGLIIDGWNSI